MCGKLWGLQCASYRHCGEFSGRSLGRVLAPLQNKEPDLREVIYIAQGHRDGDASSGVLLQPLIQSLSPLSPLHPGAPAHEDPGPSQQPLRQDPAIMRGSPSCPEGSPPGNVPGWSAARAGARPWLFWHQLQVGYLHFKQPRHALQTLSVCGPQSSYAKSQAMVSLGQEV